MDNIFKNNVANTLINIYLVEGATYNCKLYFLTPTPATTNNQPTL